MAWQQDVKHTRAGLGPDQVLIVSVVATPSQTPSLSDIATDFAQCAVWALTLVLDVVEANLSCPNVCSAEGTLYHDFDATVTVVRKIREAIGRSRCF